MSITEAHKLENLLQRQKSGSGFYKITNLPCSSGSSFRCACYVVPKQSL